MKPLFALLLPLLLLASCGRTAPAPSADDFIRVSGPDLIAPGGEKFFIRGTNLGNWLNPEGYMFRFNKTNSPGRIDRMLCELAGPDFTAEFWEAFKDNYITREDIRFIAGTGANTIRIPFHYKLFTDEDYMGLAAEQDGFARLDEVIGWCREFGVYVILDMHDAPGGQTGDNIDDSYGYPWLFESEASQQLFCDIWRDIAGYYRDEPTVLAYDLLNEPIAPYFENMEELNAKLEPVYRRAVETIREVDANHIIMLGGAQWNGNFRPLTAAPYDDQIMYTCHRYGGEPTADAIRGFIRFRDSIDRPMYMGEIGHNTDEWMAAFCRTMEENNIGWTFWPYKKINNSCFAGIVPPENWDVVVGFSEAPRGTYKEIREARPDQAVARQALLDFVRNSRIENCVIQEGYIRALGLDPTRK